MVDEQQGVYMRSLTLLRAVRDRAIWFGKQISTKMGSRNSQGAEWFVVRSGCG
jgi:hypothetical protein